MAEVKNQEVAQKVQDAQDNYVDERVKKNNRRSG
jgi:hypothetical protein